MYCKNYNVFCCFNLFRANQQEGGGSESSSNSNISLKNAQDPDKHCSNVSSESISDSSDNSNANNRKTPSCENKCGRPGLAKCQEPTETPKEPTAACSSKTPVVKGKQESEAEKDPSRRPSKDESSSSSSDSPSGDEYNLYYYDAKTAGGSTANAINGKEKKGGEERGSASSASNVSVSLSKLKKIDDPWDILFARAEGLYAHGHTIEACMLGIQLAEELLAHPPNLMIKVPPMPAKGKKKKVRCFSFLIKNTMVVVCY